jgi:hypothetical protein
MWNIGWNKTFYPKPGEKIMLWQVFWLVTCFKSLPGIPVAYSFKAFYVPNTKRGTGNIQQRGLPRIYTGFPFNFMLMA